MNAISDFEHFGLQNIQRIIEQARAAVDNMTHHLAVGPSMEECGAFNGMNVLHTELPTCFYTDPPVVRNHVSEGGTVVIEAKYDVNLISEAKMRRLIDQYSYAVRQLAIVSQSAVSLQKIDFMSPQSRAETIRWNGALPPQAVENCIHDFVLDRVVEQPDADAVCAWDGTHTYAQLDQVIEKLASYLKSFRAGPEVAIALCFELVKVEGSLHAVSVETRQLLRHPKPGLPRRSHAPDSPKNRGSHYSVFSAI